MTSKILNFTSAKDNNTREMRQRLAQALRDAADEIESDDAVQGIMLLIDSGAGGYAWRTDGDTLTSRFIALLEMHKFELISQHRDLQ